MGLFDVFRKRKMMEEQSLSVTNPTPDIPREIFLEENAPVETNKAKEFGIEAIYNFLLEDFETRGYNDALVNPDDSYKADNLLLLSQDLDILIQKVNTYYQDKFKEIDFHIASRSRAGLIDLVEELKTFQETLKDHMAKIEVIRVDNENRRGATQRIILSYQRGFMRGLSTLTQAKLFSEK